MPDNGPTPGHFRKLLRLMAALGGMSVVVAPAQAQNYPWCANFADGAGTNCGFSSEEQCRITVQGSGGYCDRNTQFQMPAAAPAQSKAHGRHVRSPRQG